MLYDQTIPGYHQALTALSGELDKALDWAKEQGRTESDLLAARLAPDMASFATQIRFTCIQAVQPAATLGGQTPPSFADDAVDVAGLQVQIAKAIAFIDDIDPTAFGNDTERQVSLTLATGMVFDLPAAIYVRDWAHPQFYFHRVTAYAILRHLGVPLGKADYVAYMMQYLRPGTAPTA
ncbi:DUF1993 domain-containing protein [Sphingopyxis sp. MWB1]|uniref:DUF1993 domain-containing protein n=1 Tax=Sphingopyxis sp. MWB1 TaxID=1537715 RepID=UPI00051A6102|nr:DUF1993 domain-containing protein [Sphingopyxis sp. MWB1]